MADFHEVYAGKLDKANAFVFIEEPVIITRSATVGQIRIKNGGKLIFKDHGPDAVQDGTGHIKIRAVNIKVRLIMFRVILSHPTLCRLHIWLK